jgi:hypothetical protein
MTKNARLFYKNVNPQKGHSFKGAAQLLKVVMRHDVNSQTVNYVS